MVKNLVFPAQSMSSIPGQGTKILHAMWNRQKKKKKKNLNNLNFHVDIYSKIKDHIFLCVIIKIHLNKACIHPIKASSSFSSPFIYNRIPWWLSDKRTCLQMQEMQEMWVWSLGWEDPLEEEMATHSRIPWTEEPGGLQPTGSQRSGHDWTHTHSYI